MPIIYRISIHYLGIRNSFDGTNSLFESSTTQVDPGLVARYASHKWQYRSMMQLKPYLMETVVHLYETTCRVILVQYSRYQRCQL